MSKHSLTTIGDYIIEECLTRRPERSVYRAHHAQSKQTVILKVLNPKLMQGWKDLELFEREVRILKNLEHPGIPRCLESFQVHTNEEQLHVLVESYISGKNLAEKLKTGDLPTEYEIKLLTLGLLDILSYLNSHHPPLIHRDIKPSNLLWSDDKKIHLLDFGAVSDHQKNLGSSTVVGTFGYMAPEQAMGKAIVASDRYSLGATLLYLLTQSPPEQWPRQGFELLWNFKHGIKEPWLGVVQGLTRVNPSERMSLEEVKTKLKNKPKLIRWKSDTLSKKKLIFQEKSKSLSIYLPEKPLKPYLFAGMIVVCGLLATASTQVWWIWPIALGGIIWHILHYQPRIYMGKKWFFKSGRRPFLTKNIENIQVVHNPYRQGLRLEYRKNTELKHVFIPLKLSPHELDKTRIYLKRYHRQSQEIL